MMKGFDLWLDALLGLLLLVLAGRTLTAPRLHQSVILFVAFGLMLALAWTRMKAPDVALAEAAIGAGLLGVLLIDSIRVLGCSPVDREQSNTAIPAASSQRPSRWGRRTVAMPVVALVIGLCSLLGMVLVMAILELPASGGLTAVVADRMADSGVDHPVTAVLLNFRGYDTWLEIGVLLLAMWGIFCAGGRIGFAGAGEEPPAGLLLDWLVRGLIPLIILVAGYLLWMGKSGPGGAFQAGVVLGAAGILLRLTGRQFPQGLPELAWKGLLILGFGFLLVTGLLTMLAGGAYLEYPREWAAGMILMAEGAAALSIGFTLLCFFAYLQTLNGGEVLEQPTKDEH
jgi:multisubunit Na+/H+ antiporter MnhB subunit